MLYDSYHKKITKILNILRKIFKHIVLISIVTGILLASLITFMIIKGIVLDDKNLTETFEITYGDDIPLNSRAIFAKVTYEYSTDGSEWTTDAPINQGDYMARATAKTVFGQVRYGMVYKFSINQKEIKVSVDDDRVTYGELPSIKAELAYEDKIICESVDYADRFASQTMVTPNVKSIRIENAEEKDVTKNYKINAVATDISVNPRPITIIISGKEMVYNNTVLSDFDGYEVSEETPAAYNDFPQAILNASITEVGEIPNTPVELKMLNEDGEDVSMHYQIDTKVGVLKVSQRPLILKTASKDKVYDDVELSDNSVELLGEYDIVEGHILECTSQTAIKNVGEVKNTLVFKIKNEEGEDKTANYSLFYEEGTLKVTPRPLNVSSTGKTWVYDGTAHPTGSEEIELVSISGACPNHTFTPSYNQIIDAGTIKNEITINDIRNATGESVLSNYEIIYGDFGDLVVTPRPVTIRPYYVGYSYGDYDYDGYNRERTYKTYDGNTFAPNNYAVSSETPLPSYHSITPAYKSVGPDVGTYKAEMDLSQTKIYRNGTDATANFEISVQSSDLSITERPITLKANSSEKKFYDGLELTDSGFSYVPNNALVSGHTVTATVTGSQTDVGSSLNVISNGIIKDALGNDVTKNYEISYENGTLSVLGKRTLRLKVKDISKSYDGNPLTYGNGEDGYYTYINGASNNAVGFSNSSDTLAEGHVLSVKLEDAEASRTNIGTTAASIVIEDIFIKDANGNSVKDNYNVIIDDPNGEITITQRTITVRGNALKKQYDGVAYDYDAIYLHSNSASNPLYTIEGTLLDGHTVNAQVFGYQLYVGSSTLDISNAEVKNGNDIAKDENGAPIYSVSVYDGSLTITRIKITITTGSDSKPYDGKPLTNSNWSFSPSTALLSGDTIQVSFEGSQTEVGSSPNHVKVTIKDALNQTLLEHSSQNESSAIDKGAYELEFNLGTLTVTKTIVKIYLKNGIIERDYTGSPVVIDPGEFVFEGPEGLSIKQIAINTIVNANEKGYFLDDILDKSSLVIQDSNGNNVTMNCDIQYDADDKLIVYPKNITVQSGTAEFEYTGRPHTYKHAEVIDGESFMNSLNHTIDITVTGSRTEEGTSDNTIGGVSIFDKYGEDVTKNYKITKRLGTITVKKTVVASIKSDKTGYIYLKTKSYGDLTQEAGKIVFGPAHENNASQYFTLSNSTKYYSYILWPAAKRYETGKTANVLTISNASKYILPYFMLSNDLSSENYDGYLYENTPAYNSEDYSSIIPPEKYVVPYYPYSFEDDGKSDIWVGTISSNYQRWVKNSYLTTSYTNTFELVYAFGDYYNIWNSLFGEDYYNGYYGYSNAESFFKNELNIYNTQNLISYLEYYGYDKEELINMIARYIRSCATYDTDYNENLDAENDIAIAFLLEYRRGDAKHFAMTATMLYRALSIPARYAEGYIVNVASANTLTDVKDAHAWVEVFIEDSGWVYMEVTPGFGGKTAEQKINISLKPSDKESEYTGEEQLPDGVELVDPSDELLELFDPETGDYEFRNVKFDGGQTDVGVYENENGTSIEDIRIFDKKTGKDVTHMFDIDLSSPGSLVITKKTIKIALSIIEKTYDETVLEYDEGVKQYYLRDSEFKQFMLENGYVLDVKVTFNTANAFSLSVSQINKALTDPSSNYAEYISIKFTLKYADGRIVDEGDNYCLQVVPYNDPDAIDSNEIVAQIKPISIEITAASDEDYYNENEPTVLQNSNYTVTECLSQFAENNGLFPGHRMEVVVEGSLDKVGTAENVITSVIIYDQSNNDVSQNYSIKTVNGTLRFLESNKN